ncbi:hypothetical protein [Natrinema saccharevitans]|uniref:hypothetical protein n=1 Tax=Natrinema saccharevitans TaxID=301967 RepID=UPI001FEA13F5|nr:hypothetical protein [Natrinema saccharevitans]
MVSTTVAGLSGCISSIYSSSQSVLSCIEIASADTQSHTIHVRVDYENEEIFSNSYDIENRNESGPLQHQWIDQDWPDEPGHFRVHMRMDGDSEGTTVDSKEVSDEYALQVAYWIGRDGSGIPYWETIDSESYEEDRKESIII